MGASRGARPGQRTLSCQATLHTGTSLKLVAGLQSFGVPAHPVGMHLMEAGGWMLSTGVPAHPVAGTPD